MIGTGWKNTTISLHCNRDTPVPFAKGVWNATYGCWKAGAIRNSADRGGHNVGLGCRFHTNCLFLTWQRVSATSHSQNQEQETPRVKEESPVPWALPVPQPL